jgi:hypothetical protein
MDGIIGVTEKKEGIKLDHNQDPLLQDQKIIEVSQHIIVTQEVKVLNQNQKQGQERHLMIYDLVFL